MKKLAIITTHPIQYNAPLFKLISERGKIEIKVFYTWEQSKERVYDEKFGREIKWDIPLLEGYDYTFVKNISKTPGSAKFYGIINPTLIQEIEEWQANAILVFGWNHHSHFRAMRYFKKNTPVFFRGDSTLLDEQKGIKEILRRIWLSFVYRFIDRAFYVGSNNKQYYLKHGIKEKQLVFAPHSIDNERYKDNNSQYSDKAKDWRKKLGYAESDMVILFIGKFEQKKDPLLLIEAAKQLSHYKFLFVGNGELENNLKEQAMDLKNVQFLPFQNQSQMPVVYRLGNIFVLPSKGPHETWGLAVNEAMACGNAILVSDKVGCALDLVKNGENGYIFGSRDVIDLQDKIGLLENKYLEFGKVSVNIIKEWNFVKIVEELESSFLENGNTM
ncbi:MAG: glycosyltransferase family 4 protein [Bacteroidota bacterium]